MSDEIRRYMCDSMNDDHFMQPMKTGAWVKYSDHQKTLKATRAQPAAGAVERIAAKIVDEFDVSNPVTYRTIIESILRQELSRDSGDDVLREILKAFISPWTNLTHDQKKALKQAEDRLSAK